MSSAALTPLHLIAKAVDGASWMVVEQVVTSALKLATLPVLARLLSPAEFGLAAAALLIAQFAFMFSELAMGQALVQRPQLRPEHVRVAFTVMLLLGVGAATAVAISAPAIASFFGMPSLEGIVPVLAVLIPIQSLSAISLGLLSRQNRFRYLALARLPCAAFGYSLVAIGLALAGAGVWALVLSTISRDLSMLLALYAAARHDLRPSFNRQAIKDLAGFSTGQTLVKLANFVAQNGDYAVVGGLLGAQALGYYGRAYQLIMLPTTFMSSVTGRVLFPLMASVKGDRARLARAYLRCITASVAFTLLQPPAPSCLRLLLAQGFALGHRGVQLALQPLGSAPTIDRIAQRHRRGEQLDAGAESAAVVVKPSETSGGIHRPHRNQLENAIARQQFHGRNAGNQPACSCRTRSLAVGGPLVNESGFGQRAPTSMAGPVWEDLRAPCIAHMGRFSNGSA
jgi:Polysaccharide biosynthesis protein